jgi:uncharacterized NAD-dependent epimerase/dehydratase family protein
MIREVNEMDMQRKENGNQKVIIVMIDSGVDTDHPWLKNAEISGLSIVKKDNGHIIETDYSDNFGHGTAVSGILVKSTADVELKAIKLYNKDEPVEIETLIYALEHIEHNIKCDIINMSCGVLCSSPELYQVCRRLSQQGIILVAAFDNIGAVSYPAAYDEVIGVDSSSQCIRPDEIICFENNMINIAAKGGNQRLAWVDPQFIINQGASFSAPHVTALIAGMLQLGIKPENIMAELKLKAKRIIKNSCAGYTGASGRIPFTIEKAAVFPYNKETHSLINYPELLDFKIVDIYDIKYLGKINQKVISIDGKKEYQLKSIAEIDYEKIDTLILGHLTEIDIYTNQPVKERIIQECLRHGVNIYSFDNEHVGEYVGQFRNINRYIFYPRKEKNEFNHGKAGRLYSINAPVLGVYGTTNQQGKFTLQLQLRKLFLKNHYNIGQLGSEPTALLFGMDDIYPFGYASTVDMEGTAAVEAINEIMHNIDLKNPELILTGCQAGTVPMYFSNLVQLHVQQIEFLLGTLPDAVVLCINMFDDFDLIKRTITAIENLIDCKVIALAVSPLVFPNGWYMMNSRKALAGRENIESFKNDLTEKFGMDSFVIGNDHEIEQLYNICIDYFSF